MAGSWSGSGRYRAPDALEAREPTDHSQVHPARGAHLSVFNQSMVMTNQEFDADCRHCGGRLVLPDADRRSAVRTACPSTSRRGELSPHQISRAPLQCPDPFRRPAQQTKLWSVPHACCPRAMHPCIQPPRASRPRAAPCDPSTLVPTCSAARCSRPVCARRRVYRVTSWGARDGLGRFRDVRLTLVLCCAAQDLKALLAGGR